MNNFSQCTNTHSAPAAMRRYKTRNLQLLQLTLMRPNDLHITPSAQLASWMVPLMRHECDAPVLWLLTRSSKPCAAALFVCRVRSHAGLGVAHTYLAAELAHRTLHGRAAAASQRSDHLHAAPW